MKNLIFIDEISRGQRGQLFPGIGIVGIMSPDPLSMGVLSRLRGLNDGPLVATGTVARPVGRDYFDAPPFQLSPRGRKQGTRERERRIRQQARRAT